MWKATSGLIGLSLALVACQAEPTGAGTDRLRASKHADGVRLDNLSDHPTGYAIFDKNTLALIDWTPCQTQSTDCLRLPAKGSVVVPFSEIMHYSGPGTEVAIYSWWVLSNGMGPPVVNVDALITLKL
jgi:hypothetical protein